MKNSKKLLTMLLTGMLTVGLSACGGETSNSTGTPSSNPSNTSTSTKVEDAEKGPIKELTAKSENASIKIGETSNIDVFYTMKGYKTLTTKQKKVTITSSNPDVVSVASNNKQITAVALGTSEITVTSEADTTMSCKFTMTVEDCFFDRTTATMGSTWDLSKETDPTNPSIKVDSNNAEGIYARNSDGLKWYIETEITIHEVHSGEEWPKFGIVANTGTNTEESANNKLYFFLDAPMNAVGSWKNFGVCEVSSSGNWAWNPGVGNNVARHNDRVASIENSIEYDKSFKMGMLRDGFNCHLFVADNYIGSVKVLGSILGNYDLETADYTIPVACTAGLFSFNSTVTFSNYKFINDAAEVDAKMPAEPIFNENWADD